MIPKVIHYIWLGGKKLSPSSLMMINTWKRNLPDYKIIQWNEENLPIDKLKQNNRFLKECMDKQLWAFASDYIRLWILYNYGGIYLDTDVEVVKSFDPLLNEKVFFGFEAGDDNIGEYIGTGIIGSEKKSYTMNKLLSYYDSDIWNTKDYINTILFKKMYLQKRNYYFKETTIFPRDFFAPYSPYDFVNDTIIETSNTYAIHWYHSNWSLSFAGYAFITTKYIKNPIIKELIKVKRGIGYLKRRASK